MLRFAEMPFTVLPEKDDVYLVKCIKPKRWGTFYSYSCTPEGGWNTLRLSDGSVSANSSISPEDMQKSYAYWLRPISDDSLTPWSYDQLLEELAVRCSMALDSKEQELEAIGASQGRIDDATWYLRKGIEYIKRMMSMLEGEIN